MKTKTLGATLFIALLISTVIHFSNADSPPSENTSDTDLFLSLILNDTRNHTKTLEALYPRWNSSFDAMALEVARFGDRRVREQVLLILKERAPDIDFYDWKASMQWLWNQPDHTTKDYARFKSELYRVIDKKFADYFAPERKQTIRLDEIVWGGVKQDGIPPLRHPEMIQADDADYLNDDDVIFGIEMNGDVRAYPKRILAWHEMFVDTVGGVEVAGVYCTLCGSVILYETKVQGTHHHMGTSGFLYRSNKLMYDQATQSLWNTLQGEPVVGPLVGQGITLPRRSIVTTDWKTWKQRHPETKVLSLNTGHRRDYGEGVAYRDYFSTDKLMFPVPLNDTRLKNKDEVVSLMFGNITPKPLAIHTEYLDKHPLYQHTWNGQRFVILTDTSGANRVYELPKAFTFKSWDQTSQLTDSEDNFWQVTESALTASDGRTLRRLPSHRAFWFGWHAAFPDTELIQ